MESNPNLTNETVTNRFNQSLDAVIRNSTNEGATPFDLESNFVGTHSIERIVMHAKHGSSMTSK